MTAIRVDQELRGQQRELLTALGLHLRTREALELAAAHLADEAAKKVREWEKAGLLAHCRPLRQAVSRMESAREEELRSERFVLVEGSERLVRARAVRRQSERDVIQETWAVLRSLGGAVGSGR